MEDYCPYLVVVVLSPHTQTPLLLRDKGYMRSLAAVLSAGGFKMWNGPNAWCRWEVLLEMKTVGRRDEPRAVPVCPAVRRQKQEDCEFKACAAASKTLCQNSNRRCRSMDEQSQSTWGQWAGSKRSQSMGEWKDGEREKPNGPQGPSVPKVSAVGGDGGTGLAHWELGVLWFDFSA